MKLLQKYKRKLDNGDLFSETNGGLTLLSPENKSKLKEFICDGHFNKTSVEYNEKIEELMIATAASQNIGGCTLKPICRSTRNRLEKKLHVKTAHVDNVRAAREESCASLRNIVSMAAMNDGIINEFTVTSHTHIHKNCMTQNILKNEVLVLSHIYIHSYRQD
jgi:hypothetical protein